MSSSRPSTDTLLRRLGLKRINPGVFDGHWSGSGEVITSISPVNGRPLASVRAASIRDYDRVSSRARAAFQKWRSVPPPRRGEIVRQLGNALREAKRDLGRLVTLEAG